MPSSFDLANAIRFLSIDAIAQASSGHPGAPMGLADAMEVLWNGFLKHNPKDPHWPDRDRFVLSNGHASMLLYALLHLTGYALPLSELKRFRQLGSKTPGHPEFGVTPGVETTTGPLGQGLANGVGMALAEKILASFFNRPGYKIVDHYTYVLAGDGCLMEGLSHEACSLAGTLGLGKLIVFYDDNGISIDGQVPGWFADDTPARFRSYGWQVIPKVDGHDPEQVRQAIIQAREEERRPTLICCQTRIGFGAPSLEGSEKTHGSPLSAEEIAGARKKLGWPYEPFVVPEEIYQAFDASKKGQVWQEQWEDLFQAYTNKFPELAQEFERRMTGELPLDFGEQMQSLVAEMGSLEKDLATRKASRLVLDHLAPGLPELIGGSADLSGSNQTRWTGARSIVRDDFQGNYLHFGVREFAMVGIGNGLALHGGFIPYGGTFLVFSDYARNAIRMAALMGLRNIFVLTHDSIGVGEDGPTHQPVEHLAALRLIPNLHVWRPCDLYETLLAWSAAVERTSGPTALVLSRQTLPAQVRSKDARDNVRRGGYVLWESTKELKAILLATGSEVSLALEAALALEKEGLGARVVSMPCVEVFASQDQSYKDQVLPKGLKVRVAVEAGRPEPWFRYTGVEGKALGVEGFGLSAPGPQLFAHFGLTKERIIDAVLGLLGL